MESDSRLKRVADRARHVKISARLRAFQSRILEYEAVFAGKPSTWYPSSMSHLHRFYISPEADADREIVLSNEEAHHALHVVRLRPGERALLFDGCGREIEGVVSRVTHREVAIAPEQERRFPKPSTRVVIAQAWLLREKSVEHLIHHGTEIGVSEFRFFRARHSEKTPKLNPKWERCAIETCKQCCRTWLPTFKVADDLATVLGFSNGPILIATQSESPHPIAAALESRKEACEITLLVGPEGDFTQEEVEKAMELSARPISLGDATYRSEVAATLAASLILYELGALGPR
jgi:16S rRNA (uracil1498-N3)-methyltransferase